jgi:hypothetical protein
MLSNPDKKGRRTVLCHLKAEGEWVVQSKLTPRVQSKGREVNKMRVTRRAYRRKNGTLVKAATYLIKDKGKPGRTPKAKRWFAPKVKSGWSKGLPANVRRARVLRAHGGDFLSSARSKQSLANVTVDGATKRAALADAKYFYAKYGASKKR